MAARHTPPKASKSATHLDLDELERPDAPDAFSATIGGKKYIFLDAKELDYRELLEGFRAFEQGNPDQAIGLMLDPDDRDAFFENRLPSWKLEALFTAYNEHHGIDPGEADASLRALRGTAGR
jgi:hypothetical protein